MSAPGHAARTFAIVLAGASCGTPEPSAPDANEVDADARPVDAPGSLPDAPVHPKIQLDDGFIPVAARKAFCEEVVGCENLSFADCMEIVDDSASVLFAIPGCNADDRLLTAMECLLDVDYCASTTCDAAMTAWSERLTSTACEVEVYSVGVGDRYPNDPSAGDSKCANGIRAAGGWCTRACSSSASCAGLATGGLNHFGTANVCAHDSLPAGFACYPTCTSTLDCQNWFGELREGARIACKMFNDGSAPEPICVRVVDNRGVELP